jgi:hypothetical protein
MSWPIVRGLFESCVQVGAPAVYSFWLKISVYCVSSYKMNMPNSVKGSRLKPDAPEFVPTQLISTPTDHPKLNPKETAKAQKKKERDERKAASLAKKADKKVAKNLGNPDGTCLSSRSYRSLLTSNP